MAKDNTDNTTTDFIGLPAKRGRPATGKAKSSAERMRAYRQRLRENGEFPLEPGEPLPRRIQRIEALLGHALELCGTREMEIHHMKGEITTIKREKKELEQQCDYWKSQHAVLEKQLNLLRQKNSLKR